MMGRNPIYPVNPCCTMRRSALGPFIALNAMSRGLMRVTPNGITPSSPPLMYPESSHSIRCIRGEMYKGHHGGQQQYS